MAKNTKKAEKSGKSAKKVEKPSSKPLKKGSSAPVQSKQPEKMQMAQVMEVLPNPGGGEKVTFLISDSSKWGLFKPGEHWNISFEAVKH